jgi:hypothetical protein
MKRLVRIATVFASASFAVVSLSAQTEGPAPLPNMLQGLPQQILDSKPIQRFLFNYQMRANADGTFPDAPGARLLPSIRQIDANIQAFPYVLNSRWTSLGPQPITGGQIGNALTTRPMSGRVASLAVHPTDLNRWLVGTANGGIWETKDGGVNFVALTDAAASLAIGAVAYAPSSPNTIYAGTGEATFSGSAFGGEGVLKSIDGGVNWQQLAAGTFIKGTAFSDIRVDPGNANTLVAATSLGIFGRANVRPPGNGARGLWRSTDGGVTWTRTLTSDGISISPHPSNFQQQYAGLGFGTNVTTAVQRSIDGGQTWATVPGPWNFLSGTTDRTEVVVSPSNPNRVYAALSNAATSGMFGLWTTANAWDPSPTWTQISLAPTDDGTGTLGPCAFDKAFNVASQQCWYNMTLTVKPTDENMLFFGGIPLWGYTLSTNTWAEVSQTALPANRNNGIHVDQHATAWAGSRLIVGNDGGVWSTTTDGTGAWTTHNNTLNTIQYYEGSATPDGSRLIGGSQDNGSQLRTASNAWPLIFGGDGAGSISTSATNIGVSSQNQNVARSLNGGATFTSVRGNFGGAAPFIGRMRECPGSLGAPGTVILNGSRVNRTTNFYNGPAGTLWSNGGFIFTGATAGIGLAFGNVCTIMGATHSSGEIRISTTGGLTQADFVERDPGAQVPNRPVSTIAFDPNSNTKVCVGLSGFSGGAPANFYCTVDFTAGTPTWTNLSVPVDVSINSIIFDPSVANRIYAGSDFGVWVTSDAGLTWAHWGPQVGMPNVPVFDVVARGGKVFAFTHGRGAFVLSNFDLNGDTVVNCADVNIVRSAFGKKVGDVGFNVLADLNSDNIVNIRDLTMLSRQLVGGTSCP